jgi:hypothetical protein
MRAQKQGTNRENPAGQPDSQYGHFACKVNNSGNIFKMKMKRTASATIYLTIVNPVFFVFIKK